jgi:hypothetical protein
MPRPMCAVQPHAVLLNPVACMRAPKSISAVGVILARRAPTVAPMQPRFASDFSVRYTCSFAVGV